LRARWSRVYASAGSILTSAGENRYRVPREEDRRLAAAGEVSKKREINFSVARVSIGSLHSQERIHGLWEPCWAKNKFKTGRKFLTYSLLPGPADRSEIRRNS
jgi:hypothetical protein